MFYPIRLIVCSNFDLLVAHWRILHLYLWYILFRGIQEIAENYIEENITKLEKSVDIDKTNEISDTIEKHDSHDFSDISEHKHREVESEIKDTGEDISRSIEESR